MEIRDSNRVAKGFEPTSRAESTPGLKMVSIRRRNFWDRFNWLWIISLGLFLVDCRSGDVDEELLLSSSGWSHFSSRLLARVSSKGERVIYSQPQVAPTTWKSPALCEGAREGEQWTRNYPFDCCATGITKRRDEEAWNFVIRKFENADEEA